jgi:hypothetical protein
MMGFGRPMKGLELSEAFYRSFGIEMIRMQFPLHADRITVGLAGLGSECFGFDDALSQDHDWGPGFCMWLEKEDYSAIGLSLQQAYDALPDFMGFRRQTSQWGNGRVGVLQTGAFYTGFIGSPHAPENPYKWLTIQEASLAACTNGRVFNDPLGKFSGIRNALLQHYPEDIRLKKIAARCMTAAQSGQYNYGRSLRRNAGWAAFQARARFCEDALALVFLLNRRYMPFYKWAHTAARYLPLLGTFIFQSVDDLVREEDPRKKEGQIEVICGKLIAALQSEGLSDADSDFLLDHGPSVHTRIQDKRLKELDMWWSGA